MGRFQAEYDHVILLSNDFNLDRRMIRTATALRNNGLRVLVIYRRMIANQRHEFGSIDLYPIDCIFKKGPLFYFELNLRMVQILRKFKYTSLTAVDVDTIISGYYGNLYRRPVKRYFDAHEWFEEVPELLSRNIKKAIWRWVAKTFVPRYDVRYTVSGTIGREMSDSYGAIFEVIRNIPTPGKFFRSSHHLGHPLKMVYLGALNPGRGLDELILSLRNEKRVSLDIYGHGPEESKLIEKASGNESITFKGYLNREDIPGMLIAYDIGILLLESESKSYYFSLANKTFDYLHAGLPVMTMAFPEYEILNQLCPAFILLDNIEHIDIGNIVVKLFDEPDYYNTKQQQALRSRELWTWENEEKLLLELYKQELS